MNTLEFEEEVRNKEHVKQAADVAQTVRDDLKKLARTGSGTDKKVVENIVVHITEIEIWLGNEPEDYKSDFYWINRTTNDLSLNIDAYMRAAYYYQQLKDLKLARKYCEQAIIAVESSIHGEDRTRIEELNTLLQRIVKEEYENLPEGKAAAAIKEKDKKLAGMASICFTVSRVLLVILAVGGTLYAFAGGTAWKKPFLPLITVVFILAIAVNAFSFMLVKHNDLMGYETSRPVVLAPIEYMIYSLTRYIFCGMSKQSGFLGGQLILVLVTVAVGIVAGIIVNKKRPKITMEELGENLKRALSK